MDSLVHRPQLSDLVGASLVHSLLSENLDVAFLYGLEEVGDLLAEVLDGGVLVRDFGFEGQLVHLEDVQLLLKRKVGALSFYSKLLELANLLLRLHVERVYLLRVHLFGVELVQIVSKGSLKRADLDLLQLDLRPLQVDLDLCFAQVSRRFCILLIPPLVDFCGNALLNVNLHQFLKCLMIVLAQCLCLRFVVLQFGLAVFELAL